MTNPVPTHAPKTDTPATPIAETHPMRQFVHGMTRDQLEAYALGAFASKISTEQTLWHTESTLAAERASRVQADTEQFNAGIEAAALLAEPDTAVRDSDEARMLWKRDWKLAYGIRSLAKPSVSPEQETE